MIERRVRIQKVLELIQKHEKLTARKLKALVVLQTGAKSQTVDAYIADLENAGLIEWEDGLYLKAVV